MMPDELLLAAHNCRNLYTEVPLDEDNMREMSKCLLLPNGGNMSEIVSPSTFSKVNQHIDFLKSEIPKMVLKDSELRFQFSIKRINVNAFTDVVTRNLNKMGPFSFMMRASALHSPYTVGMGLSPTISEVFYNRINWHRHGNKITGIETVKEQCNALNSLDRMPEAITVLEAWLKQMENARLGKLQPRDSMHDFVLNYRLGNADALEGLLANMSSDLLDLNNNSQNQSVSPLRDKERDAISKISEMFGTKLRFERNKVMGKRIVDILKAYKGSSNRFSDTTCFVMGVGHLLGEDSVIKVAEAEGFKLNNVRTEEEIGSPHVDCLD